MTREELQNASDALRRAAEAADDEGLEGRIYEQSNEMAKLATQDRGPDHGRLARHIHTLQGIADDANDESGAAIDDALERISAYRETVDGV